MTRDPARIPHGRGGYANYRCRCPVCTAAHTEECREPSRRFRQSDQGKRIIAAHVKARQDATLDRAHNHRKHWTGPELELAARDDLTVEQIAVMLGRSYFAVAIARSRIRARQSEGDTMTCHHDRPGIADQLAALAMARATLGGADPAAVRQAAGDRACPACTAVAGVSLGITLAATLAGEKLGVSPELARVMLAGVDALEAELRGMSN